MIGCTISVAVNQEEICVNVVYLEATDTPAIIFWRRQCNGGKVVALPLYEGNCSCIMLSDDNRKLPAIDAEILNHNYGKNCRKLEDARGHGWDLSQLGPI